MDQPIITQLKALARQSPHQEICGVIGTDYQIYPITNAAKKKTTCFVFDRREYFDLMKKFTAAGIKILCLYHSHPSHSPEPSKADLDYTRRSGHRQIIVTPNEYRVINNA